MVSFASGCLPADALGLRGSAGEDLKGEAGRIERFGSSAKERGLDAVLLWFPSASELSRDCGPNENDEPIE